MNTLPADYEERVYAGVLGKIIGVYLGRPFEGWSNERIERELGEVHYYVHEKRGVPLIVSDDDISGTFTFLRALPDHGGRYETLTPAQIGKTWRNYLIEERSVLWWGGLGMSTEHTAFLRLKSGIEPPQSGSIETNGQIIAEQIGAQIFIDGWAMVCPGDPEKAAELARRAACVSHDGEAIYGAQVIAAMEAQAFVERSLDTLLDTAVTFIPRSSTIYELISDLREWRVKYPKWRDALARVQKKYGYDKFGGNCHMVPNHAVILLALLWGEDDFGRSLMIANTCGWDTDCNSGNVGCLMGIKNGLSDIERGVDWRGPVADRLMLPTADGGRCITDAVRETFHLVNTARLMQGQPPHHPKQGMRFHFNLPGAMQGFLCDTATDARDAVRIENVLITRPDQVEGAVPGERLLALRYQGIGPGRTGRVTTPTFLTAAQRGEPGYHVMASPTLYPGQILRARLIADDANTRTVQVRLVLGVEQGDGSAQIVRSPARRLRAGDGGQIEWTVPAQDGQPIHAVGVEIGGNAGSGTVYLDWLHWSGTPSVTLGRPADNGSGWTSAWVNAAGRFDQTGRADFPYRVIQNAGTGLVTQGEWIWSDYTVETTIEPHLVAGAGLVAGYRGLLRYVAVEVTRVGEARLIERFDDHETVLDEMPIAWNLFTPYRLCLTLRRDGVICAQVNDVELSGAIAAPRAHGANGMRVREGTCLFGSVRFTPMVEANRGGQRADA